MTTLLPTGIPKKRHEFHLHISAQDAPQRAEVLRLIDSYRATHGLKTRFAALAVMVRAAARRDGILRLHLSTNGSEVSQLDKPLLDRLCVPPDLALDNHVPPAVYYVQRTITLDVVICPALHRWTNDSCMEPDIMPHSSLGRFSDPPILILASLAGGPKHGYAIMEDIAAYAGVHLGPGTLYGAIARLESEGLIEPLPAEDRRRPYRLTTRGTALLREQLASLETFATMGLQRLATI
jgi:DNA-binding MarR family transcriptional regulator